MEIDFNNIWELVVSFAGALAVVASILASLYAILKNTRKYKEWVDRKRKRNQALNKLADNIGLLEDYRRSEKEQKEMANVIKTVQYSNMVLLRYRVNRLCKVIQEKGYMTIDEKIDLDDLYSAYEAHGGNSRTHEMYEYTISKYEIKKEAL